MYAAELPFDRSSVPDEESVRFDVADAVRAANPVRRLPSA